MWKWNIMDLANIRPKACDLAQGILYERGEVEGRPAGVPQARRYAWKLTLTGGKGFMEKYGIYYYSRNSFLRNDMASRSRHSEGIGISAGNVGKWNRMERT